MSYNLRTYNRVDTMSRTITVPPGGGLTGAIKDALAKDGWKITVYRGPEVTRGTVGEQTRLERSNTFRSRYTAFLRWDHFDTCVPSFDGAYNYDLSVVDNEDGSEVMTLSGKGCERRIVEKFMDGLHSRQ